MLCTLQAFTPIATMVGLFVAGLETPTKRLILAVLLIAIGTAIASYGEVNLSWIGVACMMAPKPLLCGFLVFAFLYCFAYLKWAHFKSAAE